MNAKLVRPGAAKMSQDAHLAIAVFDDWHSLRSVVNNLCGSSGSCPSAIVLSRDLPQTPEDLNLPGSLTRLRFTPALYATCSRGRIADHLVLRLSHGPHTLAHALHDWLPLDQCWKLESHIEQGRLVLMLELRGRDDHEALCATLVRHSPHIVRLLECDVHMSRR